LCTICVRGEIRDHAAVFIHCIGVLVFERYDFCAHIIYFNPVSDDVMSSPDSEGGCERLGMWPANGTTYSMIAADRGCITKGPRLRHDGKWLD
jgi:hypothetical protein